MKNLLITTALVAISSTSFAQDFTPTAISQLSGEGPNGNETYVTAGDSLEIFSDDGVTIETNGPVTINGDRVLTESDLGPTVEVNPDNGRIYIDGTRIVDSDRFTSRRDVVDDDLEALDSRVSTLEADLGQVGEFFNEVLAPGLLQVDQDLSENTRRIEALENAKPIVQTIDNTVTEEYTINIENDYDDSELKADIASNLETIATVNNQLNAQFSYFDHTTTDLQEQINNITAPIVINGIDGIDGVNGRDGVDGRDGIDGRDGAKGDKGDRGERGERGADGRDGRDGIDGVTTIETIIRVDEEASEAVREAAEIVSTSVDKLNESVENINEKVEAINTLVHVDEQGRTHLGANSFITSEETKEDGTTVEVITAEDADGNTIAIEYKGSEIATKDDVANAADSEQITANTRDIQSNANTIESVRSTLVASTSATLDAVETNSNRIADLEAGLSSLTGLASAGIAGNAATISGLSALGGESGLYAGLGNFNGVSALSIGLQFQVSDNVTFNFGGSVDTYGKAPVTSAGLGIKF